MSLEWKEKKPECFHVNAAPCGHPPLDEQTLWKAQFMLCKLRKRHFNEQSQALGISDACHTEDRAGLERGPTKQGHLPWGPKLPCSQGHRHQQCSHSAPPIPPKQRQWMVMWLVTHPPAQDQVLVTSCHQGWGGLVTQSPGSF